MSESLNIISAILSPIYKNPNVCGINSKLSTKNNVTKKVMNTNCITLMVNCCSNTSLALHLPNLAGLEVIP